jgi:GntR family transcriptional regulator, vanillate catabolism transcriptional regulator
MTTQQARVVVQLREMVLRGDLPAGERLTEEALAERLKVSRTPIRAALPVLAQEGLLTPSETRGYFVRAFSTQDVLDAIDLRGLIEGMAGRLVAERGASPALLRDLRDCLAEGDGYFAASPAPRSDEEPYMVMNGRFHLLILEAAGSRVLTDALAQNSRIPFASPQSFAFGDLSPAAAHELLRYTHRQHHAIVGALERGEATRVEALLREHAQPVKDSLNITATQDRTGPVPRLRELRPPMKVAYP